jgi:hypothetical protein
MKTGLKHPVWIHLPAVAALITFCVYVFRALPLPGRVPIHFNTAGIPNDYGSPWLVVGLTIGLSLLYIAISFVLDDMWASQERKKAFNWLTIMDDVIVGALCGAGIAFLLHLESGSEKFSFPWVWVLAFGGGGLVLAVLLEMLRPYRSNNQSQSTISSKTKTRDLSEQIKSRPAFVFYDSQNPPLMMLMTIVLPLIMFVWAAVSYSEVAWVSILLAVTGLLLILPYGGMRVMVTRNDITVRFGLFGFRILRLDIAEIISIETIEFSPLKDFGGYGIRFNREMKAYYLRGNRGVKLTMASGKKYLLGSDDPQLLAGVIQALAGTGKV